MRETARADSTIVMGAPVRCGNTSRLAPIRRPGRRRIGRCSTRKCPINWSRRFATTCNNEKRWERIASVRG